MGEGLRTVSREGTCHGPPWDHLWVFAARGLVVAALLVIALTPRASAAAACDDWLRQPRSFTGTYLPSSQPDARAFVFAMLVTCPGKNELVTVQSAGGGLPVCGLGQDVELTGTLIWNKAGTDARYEITDPTGMTCSGTAVATTKAGARRAVPAPVVPEPQPPVARAPEPPAPAPQPSAPASQPPTPAPEPAAPAPGPAAAASEPRAAAPESPAPAPQP